VTDKENLENIVPFSKKSRVLYVEDNEKNMQSTLYVLKEFFDTIILATDGLEGLDIYKKNYDKFGTKIDIVISDINMPNLDGIGLVESIYKIDAKQKIIILSAHDEAKYLLPLINMGVSAFIQKPLTLSSILKALNPIYLENKNIINLKDTHKFDMNLKVLYCNSEKIKITTNDIKLIELFLSNKDQYFSLQELHTHLFFTEPYRDFNIESIRGILKRLRAKLPNDLIINNKTLGFKIDL